MQIHIARNGQPTGPFPLEEINRQLAAGTLDLSDQAWHEGAAGWAPLSTVPGVSGGTTAPAAVVPTAGGTAVAVTVVAPPTEPLAILSLVLSLLGILGFAALRSCSPESPE
jgi:uncharacterized protein DUF4339